MTRRAITIFVATIVVSGGLTETLNAQNRGGGRRGGGAVRVPPAASSAPRSTFSGRIAPRVAAPRIASPRIAAPRIVAPRVFGGRGVAFTRSFPRVIAPQPFIPVYSPFVWGSSFYPEPAYIEPVYAAPQVAQSPTNLADEVQRLRLEIEQLRLELSLLTVRQAPPPAAAVPVPGPSEPARPATPTILIFRDGHRQTVLNYVIVGQTLWALDEKAAAKIPLSDLDLDASQKENRSQGVRFPPAR